MLSGNLFRSYGILYVALSVFLVSGILWLPQYPIMIDLPQHAGQLAAMQGLMTGEGHWADTLRINWFTPYLIGYLAALPFTLWLKLAPLTALKIVLSAAYILYIYALKMLAEALGADRRLAWLYLPSFFGLPWVFGLYSFLVAIPVGVLLLYVSMLYAENSNKSNTLKLVLAASILFFCHGLAFPLFVAISYSMVFLSCAEGLSRSFLKISLPYILFGIIWVLYFLTTKSTSVTLHEVNFTNWGALWKRPIQILFSPWGTTDEYVSPLYSLICLVFPWALGLRPSRKLLNYLPLICVLLVWFAAPLTSQATTLLYSRVAILIFPFYSFIFFEPKLKAAKYWQSVVVIFFIAFSMFAIQKSYRAYIFNIEAVDFNRIALRMKPNLRVLSLINDADSKRGAIRMVYLNFPMYYQANSGGLVDPSFSASVAPPVFYLDEKRPKMSDDFIWSSHMRNYKEIDLSPYDYILIRDEHGYDEAHNLMTKQPVSFAISAHEGNWTLLKRTDRPSF